MCRSTDSIEVGRLLGVLRDVLAKKYEVDPESIVIGPVDLDDE